MKPLYKFLIIGLILGIIAWIIYFVISKNTTQLQPSEESITSTTTETIDEVTPNEGKIEDIISTTTENTVQNQDSTDSEESVVVKTSFKEIKKISDVPARFYWYYSENNRIFYTTEKGEIKKVIDGKSETVEINPLKNLSVVRPNNDGSFVLLKFTGDSGIVWGVFSSMDEKITPINTSIDDAVWDFNNQDIIALLNKNNSFSISSLSALKNFSESSILIPEIKLFDVEMFKKSQDELVFVEKTGSGYATSIFQYNIKTKIFSIIKRGVFDFSIHPTPSSYFIFSKNDGFVIGNRSFERLVPTTQTTFPNKCSSVLTTAFCFVPKNSIQLFDWLTNSVFSNDSLYIYDLYSQTETESPLSEITKTAIDAKDVLSTFSSVYFINKYDNLIYALN